MYEGKLDNINVVKLSPTLLVGNTEALFEFKHPGKVQLIQEKVLTFTITMDCYIHGFAGWFDCILYDDVFMSNSPINGNKNMASWFPTYIPISRPVKVKTGQKVKLWFARKSDKEKVWYEWSLLEPELLPIQNPAGATYSIGLSSN